MARNHIIFATYEDAEVFWSASEKLNYRQITPGLKFRTRPNDVIFELSALYATTKDERFRDAVTAISEHQLIRANKWVRNTPSPAIDGLVARYEDLAANIVQIGLNDGNSLRLAVASCAANLRWPGNSFAAANKNIERLWRSSSYNLS